MGHSPHFSQTITDEQGILKTNTEFSGQVNPVACKT